jgi:hexulose-6-phosphate isomerase
MQGRLSEPTSERIQEFPRTSWSVEFQRVAFIGLHLLEWTLDLHGLYQNPFMTPAGQKKINNLCNQYDIKVESVTLDCFLESPLHRSHPKTLAKSEMKDLVAVAESARNLGVGIGVLPLVAESGQDDRETLRSLISMLAAVEDSCVELNFQIALECEFDTETIDWISREIRELAHVGFNFDTGNSASLGNNPNEELSIYGDKLFNVHIKDRELKGKTVPLGQGNADFEAISRGLKELNYNGNMIVQAARQQRGQEIETISSYIRFCESFGWQ